MVTKLISLEGDFPMIRLCEYSIWKQERFMDEHFAEELIKEIQNEY